MWIAKIRVTSKGSILSSAAEKFNITLTGYPISYKEDSNKILVQVAGLMIGEKKNKHEFIKYIKKNKNIKYIELNKDFLIVLMEHPQKIKPLYEPHIIWIKPAISTKGFEYMEIASWTRKRIINIVKSLEEYGCKLLKIKKGKIPSISIINIMPSITDKQKKAFELAVKNGYYNFPKNIELKKLAKLMNISYSTYQAHLKKAESKLMPSILRFS